MAARKPRKNPMPQRSPATDLPAVMVKIKQLREEAAAAQRDLEETGGRGPPASPRRPGRDYGKLRRAQQERERLAGGDSAHAACDRGDYASPESLKLLALVYASQCNFDRADTTRSWPRSSPPRTAPGVLASLDIYRKMGEPSCRRPTPRLPAPRPRRAAAPRRRRRTTRARADAPCRLRFSPAACGRIAMCHTPYGCCGGGANGLGSVFW